MVELTFFLIGTIIAAGAPTIHSIYKETRFTRSGQMVLGGIASIAFGLIYFGNPDLPTQFNNLQDLAIVIFPIFGVISILVGRAMRHKREGRRTLLFAKRQFGAFAIAFLIPLLFNQNPPVIVEFIEGPEVINFGILLLIIFNALSGIAYLLKNHVKIPMLPR